jgi:hypothetical protein
MALGDERAKAAGDAGQFVEGGFLVHPGLV